MSNKLDRRGFLAGVAATGLFTAESCQGSVIIAIRGLPEINLRSMASSSHGRRRERQLSLHA
jgi:hypothetical protein